MRETMKRTHLTIDTCLVVVALSFTAETNVWASSGGSDDAVAVLFWFVGFLIAGVIAFCIYFAPALVAFKHNHSNRWVIAALNVAIAPTLIGWILLLIWAKKAAHRAQGSDGTDGGESGLNVFVNDVKRIRVEGQVNASLSTELQNLEKLRASGVLTDSEFGKAKKRLLAP